MGVRTPLMIAISVACVLIKKNYLSVRIGNTGTNKLFYHSGIIAESRPKSGSMPDSRLDHALIFPFYLARAGEKIWGMVFAA
jgi:hypothetical protein